MTEEIKNKTENLRDEQIEILNKYAHGLIAEEIEKVIEIKYGDVPEINLKINKDNMPRFRLELWGMFAPITQAISEYLQKKYPMIKK